MKIVTYTGQQADFYILNKGLNAGRPSRTPYRNSFAVFSDDVLLFQKVQVLFIGRYFEPFIHGTAIPTIRLNDVKEVIETAKIKTGDRATKQLKSIDGIDKLIALTEKKILMLIQLKTAIARETISR